MKLEIELDLNKIDYDAINKQIQEKIEAIDIQKEYDIDSRIRERISNIVYNKVDTGYNDYIDNFWRNSPTSKGERLIEEMSKQEIERRLKEVLDDVFSKEYDEETLRTTMLKVLPGVFSSILFSRMENALIKKEYDYMDRTRDLIRAELENAANRMKN